VAGRVRQLEGSLGEQRSPDERIAHLIPRRHVETWVLCLTGKDVDEETDYKTVYERENGQMIKEAAQTFSHGAARTQTCPRIASIRCDKRSPRSGAFQGRSHSAAYSHDPPARIRAHEPASHPSRSSISASRS
jgi:hypothetical protein